MAPEGAGNAAEGNAGAGAAANEGAGASGNQGGEGNAGADGAAAGQNGSGAGAAANGVADWRADITEPELKDTAARIASPKEAIKSIVDLRKANGSMVKLPGKDAKPDQIAAFRKAVGAPETIEGYVFQEKEGVEPTEADKAIRGKVAESLLKHHAPAALATELQAIVEEMADAADAEQNRVATEFRASSEAALRKEWGADFEGNVQVALRAREKLGSDGLREFLNTVVDGKKIGDHPEMVRFFGNIGRRMGESEFIGSMNAGETQSLNDKHAELTRQIHAATAKGDRSLASRLDRERSEISGRLVGNEPIVGAQGRAA